MEHSEQTERNLLELSHQVAILGEYFAWAQRCDEFIKQLEEHSRAKRPRLSIGRRQSLVARIARLEGAKTRLERHFAHMAMATTRAVVAIITRKDSFGERLIRLSKIVY